MVDFITNITAALNSVWTTAIGLFTIIALIALGIAFAALAVSSRNGGDARELISRIITILVCCAGFGAVSSIVTWALGIG